MKISHFIFYITFFFTSFLFLNLFLGEIFTIILSISVLTVLLIKKNQNIRILLVFLFAAFVSYWIIYIRFFYKRPFSYISNYLHFYEKTILISLIVLFSTIVFLCFYKIMLEKGYITIKENKISYIEKISEKLNVHFTKPMEQFYTELSSEIYRLCLPFLKKKNYDHIDHNLIIKIANRFEGYYLVDKNLKKIYILFFCLPGIIFGIILNIDVMIYNQFYYSVYFSFLLCIPLIARFLRYFFESISHQSIFSFLYSRMMFTDQITKQKVPFDDFIVAMELAAFHNITTEFYKYVNYPITISKIYYAGQDEKDYLKLAEKTIHEFMKCCHMFCSSIRIIYIKNTIGIYFVIFRLILYITALSYRLYFGWY